MQYEKIIAQFCCTVLLICAAKYQAYRFDKEQKSIKHWLWGLYYCIPLAIIYIVTKDLFLCGVCAIQRIPIFNTVLNYCRTPRRPLLYINLEGESFWDRLYGPIYVYVFWLCFSALIILQFFIKW